MATSVLQLWFKMIEPNRKIERPDHQRQARFLSALLLVVVINGILWEVYSLAQWGVRSYDSFAMAMVGVLTGLYILSRTGSTEIVARSLVGVLTVTAGVFMYADAASIREIRYFFVLFPVLVASILGSLARATGIFLLGMGVVVYSMFLVDSELGHLHYVVLMLILLCCACMLLGTWHRNLMESDRLKMIAESEAQKSAVIAAIPDALYRIAANKSCVETLTAPVKGLGYHTLLHERGDTSGVTLFRDSDEFMASVQRVVSTGNPEQFDRQVNGIDGLESYEIRVTPLDRAEALVLVRDITDRVDAEQRLQAAEERYREVSKMISDFVYVADRKQAETWRYSWSLENLERLMGSDLPVVDPRYGGLSIHPEDVEIWEKRNEHLLNGIETLNEFRIIAHDGSIHWLRDYGRPIRDEATGEVTRVYGAIQDISDAKSSETYRAELLQAIREQQAKLRELTTRLATVQEQERKQLAGELHDSVGRNLTALSYFVSQIQVLVPKSEDVTSPIHAVISDALNLIEDTSRRTRHVMAELRPPLLDDFGLAAALESHCTAFAQLTRLNVICVGADAYVRQPEDVENALFRVAQEALHNVMKHARARSVLVAVEIYEKNVRLMVKDDGIGLHPANQTKAQDEQRWGLIMMRERVESIKGKLRFESTPGEGTALVVEVPI